MSKILDAMHRSAGGHLDFEYSLRTIDSVQLFPPPRARQLEDFERLANSLIMQSDGRRGLAVTFASTARGEGTSFVSYNVARHLSVLLDKRVAWVDANFVSPTRKAQGMGTDLRTMLQDPERALRLKTGAQMVIVPNGDAQIKQTDYLVGESYPRVIANLTSQFAFVVIDAPPISCSIDVAHIARATLGLVLVVESRRLKYEIIDHSVKSMQYAGVNVMGTVLNKRRFDIPATIYKRIMGV